MSLKKELIKGTAVLTAAGLFARFLGLYNRIYLANFLSDAELGRYQLVFPVFMLCMAFSASGIQVAVSKLVAERIGAGRVWEVWTVTRMAMAISLLMACLCSGSLWLFSEQLAVLVLQDGACAGYLKILALSIPFASLHTCINGYFYGCRKTVVPAIAQLVEQVIRVVCITFLIQIEKGQAPDATVAIWGLLAGEGGGCILTVICFWLSGQKLKKRREKTKGRMALLKILLQHTGYLTANRVSVTLLQSVEVLLLPLMLARFCGDYDSALAVFGVLTGIVMPMLSFPSTLTNALSTVLLPVVSEAEALHQYHLVATAFEKSIRYCMAMGIGICLLFAAYGVEIGEVLFDDASAGRQIAIFAIACPLMYLQPLFASTLNGIGKTNETLLHHLIASAVRIASILLVVPKMGINGYLFGLLAANGIVSIIAYMRLKKLAGIVMHLAGDCLLPAVIGIVAVYLSKQMMCGTFFSIIGKELGMGHLFWQCGCMMVIFVILYEGSWQWIACLKSSRKGLIFK